MYTIDTNKEREERKMLKAIAIIVILTFLRTTVTRANERAKERAENERKIKAVKDGIEIFQRTKKENNK